MVKNRPIKQEIQDTGVRSLGWENPLEKKIATHSSIVAWEIPLTEDPDELHSMGLQRVRHSSEQLNGTDFNKIMNLPICLSSYLCLFLEDYWGEKLNL